MVANRLPKRFWQPRSSGKNAPVLLQKQGSIRQKTGFFGLDGITLKWLRELRCCQIRNQNRVIIFINTINKIVNGCQWLPIGCQNGFGNWLPSCQLVANHPPLGGLANGNGLATAKAEGG